MSLGDLGQRNSTPLESSPAQTSLVSARFYPEGTRLTVSERHPYFRAEFSARAAALPPGHLTLANYIIAPDDCMSEVSPSGCALLEYRSRSR